MRTKTKLVQVILITGLLIAQFIPSTHAWDNNYSQDNTYDSYSQSWQSYKQQNNINTQPAYQQSWWNSAINSIGNFFSSVTQAVTNFVTNVGNFFSNIVTNVQNFFVKTPDIKVNQATAPPTKDINAEQTKAIDTGIDKSLSTKNNLSDTAQRDTYKTQTTQKENPYAYLTAEKACYDPRAAGLSQFSSDYQAIEAEYAARDKWVASQQTQPEGTLADTKPTEVLDNTKPLQTMDQPQQLNQKDISVIAPAQVVHPDPSIMPAEHWDSVKNTLPVNNVAETTQTNQNIWQKAMNWIVNTTDTLRKTFFPTTQERCGDLWNKITDNKISYSALGDKLPFTQGSYIYDPNPTGLFRWQDVAGFPMKIVDFGEKITGIGARFAVGGDFGIIDGVKQVDYDDAGLATKVIHDSSGLVLGKSGASAIDFSANLGSHVLAFEGAVTTTNAVGEGSYWINYQRRFSEERWWMSSGKTSTPQGTIIDTPDGPVISETDALKRLGIN